MQDSSSQVSRPQLVRLYAANVACALVVGLCVALPGPGRDTPTVVDSLVPVAGIGSWAATAVFVGVRQIRTLKGVVRVRRSLRLRVR